MTKRHRDKNNEKISTSIFERFLVLLGVKERLIKIYESLWWSDLKQIWTYSFKRSILTREPKTETKVEKDN